MSSRRIAVVTGAAAGIGQAFAVRLAEEGHDVALADLAATDATEELVRAAGAEVLGARCDVASGSDVEGLGAAVRERFGRCDVLVANAGIYPAAPFEQVSFEDWRRVMSVNLDSLFHLTQAFLPGMRAAGWGRIVCLATNGFHSGIPQLTPYVASKGGVIGFVRSLAGEVGPDGVTINAIAPGLTRTPGTKGGVQDEEGWFDRVAATQAVKRTQVPSDLTGALAFLVSDEGGFMTGQTLAIDGGAVRG